MNIGDEDVASGFATLLPGAGDDEEADDEGMSIAVFVTSTCLSGFVKSVACKMQCAKSKCVSGWHIKP